MLKSSLVYLGQLYGLVIGIVMVPTYLFFLGVEGYGLIGFFGMLQGWMLLFDFGLSSIFLRDAARHKAGSLDVVQTITKLRGLEIYFGTLAVAFCITTYIAAPYVAESWLKVEKISPEELQTCLYLMGGATALRWLINLYRAGLLGLERQVSATGANVLLSTVRFVGVIAVLAWISPTPLAFFIYQFLIAVLELLVFLRMIDHAIARQRVVTLDAIKDIRLMFRSAASIGFTSTMWVIIQNFDKLLLSRLLRLEDFAYFMIAIAAANAINLLNAPILQLTQPRFTIHLESGNPDEFHRLYGEITQLIAALMIGVAGTLAVFSKEAIYVWTGDLTIAQNASPILFWYAIGTGIVGLSSTPFQIQFALGKMKYHVIGNIIFALLLIPGVAIAATKNGAIGVGAYWCFLSTAWLIIWIPFLHSRLIPTINLAWYVKNWGLPLLIGFLMLLGLHTYANLSGSRLEIGVRLVAIGCAIMLILALTVTTIRRLLFQVINK